MSTAVYCLQVALLAACLIQCWDSTKAQSGEGSTTETGTARPTGSSTTETGTTRPNGTSTTETGTTTPAGGSYGLSCNISRDCTSGDNNSLCLDGSCTCVNNIQPYYLNGVYLCRPVYNAGCSKDSTCLPEITSYYCNINNRCVCGFGLIYNAEFGECVYGYNADCYGDDAECGAPSLVCMASDPDLRPGICQCAPGLTFMRGRCQLDSVVNSPCDSRCPAGSNTHCVAGICLCKPGFYHNQTQNQCMLVYNSTCGMSRGVCTSGGDDNMTCAYTGSGGYHCRCKIHHFYNSTANLCLPVLGSPCTSVGQCVGRGGQYVTCKDSNDDDQVDTCLCKDGFFTHVRENVCLEYSRTVCRNGFYKPSTSYGINVRKKREDEGDLPASNICVMIQKAMSWNEAMRSCRAHSGNLLSFSDQFWANVTNSYYTFISLKADIRYGDKFWTSMVLTPDRQKLMWEGKYPHPVNFRNHSYWQWSGNQPLPLHGDCGKGEATYLYPVNISTEPCDNRLPSVCIHTAIKPELKPVPSCPSGWLGSRDLDKCFKFVKRPLSQKDAAGKCSAANGRLFNPTSILRREFVYREFLFSLGVAEARVGVSCDLETSLCKMADGLIVRFEELQSVIGGNFPPQTPGETGAIGEDVLSQTQGEICLVFTQLGLGYNYPYNQEPTDIYSFKDCHAGLPYICELDIAETESAVKISSPVYDNSIQALVYKIKNHDPDSLITFVKDGIYNPRGWQVRANSTVIFPIQGALSKQRGDMQGFYSIQVWGVKPYRRYSSEKYLVTFPEIYTFAGSMKSLYLASSAKSLTEPFLFVGGLEQASSVHSVMNAVKELGDDVGNILNFPVGTVLRGVRYTEKGGYVVDFRVYVNAAQQAAPRRRRVAGVPSLNLSKGAILNMLTIQLPGLLKNRGFIPSSLQLSIETWTTDAYMDSTSDGDTLRFLTCPDDIQSHSTSNTSRVTWPRPEVTPVRDDVMIRANYHPGHIFPLGVTTVTYTAEDKTGNEATCKFTVDVKKIVKECGENIPVPDRGTLRCRKKPGGAEQRCDVTCLPFPSNIRRNPDIAQSYTCNSRGAWEPPFQWGEVKTLACITLDPPRSYRLLFNVEHPGRCVDDGYFRPYVVTELIKWLNDGDLCPQGDSIKLCDRSQVDVNCEDDRRRRRDAQEGGIVINLALNASFSDKESTAEYEHALAVAENVTSFITNNRFRFVYRGEEFNFDKGSKADEETTCGYGQMKILERYCAPCPPGTRYKSDDKSCVSCPENTYQERRGQDVCIKCKKNEKSRPGSFSRFDCTGDNGPTVLLPDTVDVALIIGVTFAVIIVIILLVTAIFIIHWRNRSNKKKKAQTTAEPGGNQDYYNTAYDNSQHNGVSPSCNNELSPSYQSIVKDNGNTEHVYNELRTQNASDTGSYLTTKSNEYESMSRQRNPQDDYTQLTDREAI